MRASPGGAERRSSRLTGPAPAASAVGLELDAGSNRSQIVGLVIRGFSGDGIAIYSNSDAVTSCYIGTNAAGNAALANGGDGVDILAGSTGNSIGAATATPGTGAGNIISGNTGSGVAIHGVADSFVWGNLIGTDVTGTFAIANGANGVQILGGSGNTIGGADSSLRNIISGNTTNGVVINGSGGALNNLVVGNYIGTNLTGTAAIPNSLGVNIWNGATDNTIGGTGSAGNLVSGNKTSATQGDGIDIDGSSTADNLVEGNDLGTNAAVTAAVGNVSSGISVWGSSTGNTITGNIAAGNAYGIALDGATATLVTNNLVGVTAATGGMVLANQAGVLLQAGATSNTIGGTSFAAANIISGNTANGVNVGNTGTSGNVVEYNYIGTDSANDTGLGNSTGILFFGDADGGPTDNTIGPENVISGNTYAGVGIYDTGTSDNVVAGNLVGTNTGGTAPLANVIGVIIGASATANTIGGSTAAAANIISGNTQEGVQITDSGTSDNVVAGNMIGTDVTGTVALANAYGVEITTGSSNNTIGGLGESGENVISGNTDDGVYITGSGSSDNVIAGNLIGLNKGGTEALGNGAYGVLLASYIGNTVGGMAFGAGNVISGNLAGGINVSSPSTVIVGNLIGTDVTGTVALGNGHSDGIDVNWAGATIGGAVLNARNVISGNDVGISIAGVDDVLVQGNSIGTDIGGTAALPNTEAGMILDAGASSNTIGGTASSAGNVISGNTGDGISLSGSGTALNLIIGNRIGTDEFGDAALSNMFAGVSINTGPTNNTIGGTTAGAGNLISGNNADGIDIGGTGASGNVVLRNYIGTDVTGTTTINNFGAGVNIFGNATSNTIGVRGSARRNVISGDFPYGVEIDGAGAGNVVAGNYVGTNAGGTAGLGNDTGISVNTSSYTTIGGTVAGAGNVVSGNQFQGIVDYDQFDTIAGNYVGTNAAGTTAIHNGTGDGIDIGGSGDTIGGTIAGAANVISGNNGEGIALIGSDNVLEGNLIGTSASGTLSLANGHDGVFVTSYVTGETIGGTVAGAGNVISGNAGDGIDIFGASTLVVGNKIGTDITGTVGIGNSQNGISIATANNTIGGSVAGAGNVISCNTGNGVEISGSGAAGNFVQGNVIGTDSTGEVAIPNYVGVMIDSGASGNTIGSLTATPGTGPGNIISGNTDINVQVGVLAGDPTTTNNVIAGNVIGTDAEGAVGLGSFYGIWATGVGTTIGGTADGALNVISGSIDGNVVITGVAATDDLIAGNYIGLNLTGTATTGDASGNITIDSSGNTVGGTSAAARNVIAMPSGIEINLNYSSSTGNLIQGNYIGVDVADTTSLSSGATGIQEENGAEGNTIGGVVSGAANVIVAGSGSTAIILNSDTLVQGNLIDSNSAGTAVVGQSLYGIVVQTTAADLVDTGNTIGGTAQGAANILTNDGIWLEHGSQDNLVEGNISGLDITGTVKLTTGNAGIEVDGPSNTIGGTAAGAANLVAGSSGDGLDLTGSSSTGNLVEGNLIGTDITGTVAIRNGRFGLYISQARHGQHDRRHDHCGGQCALGQRHRSGDRPGLARQSDQRQQDRHRHHGNGRPVQRHGPRDRIQLEHDRRHGGRCREYRVGKRQRWSGVDRIGGHGQPRAGELCGRGLDRGGGPGQWGRRHLDRFRRLRQHNRRIGGHAGLPAM